MEASTAYGSAPDPLRLEAVEGGMRIAFAAFDTGCAITAYGNPAPLTEVLRQAVGSCRVYEGLFSRTRPRSDIGRLNRSGGDAVALDPRTYEVLQAARSYCACSKGAFDITVGPFCDLWDFKEGRIASPAALREAKRHVGWQALELWEEAPGRCFARLADAGARVDLGGIAKGWMADALAADLIDGGAQGVLIDLGGNILVRGAKPDGTLWRVALRDPVGNGGTARPIVTLREGSVVTSGTYERCFVRDGIRYHHILDPATGLPADIPWASASVVARRSIDAEGFSTTLLALGPEQGIDLLREHPEILQAFYLDWEGGIRALRP